MESSLMKSSEPASTKWSQRSWGCRQSQAPHFSNFNSSIHDEQMLTAEKQYYLGDIISNTGYNDENIKENVF